MVAPGIRLQLLIGDTIPAPASYEVVKALEDLEVRNETYERDTFKITFTLGRNNLVDDFGLLRSGVLEAERRLIVVVLFGVRSEILIDGIITRHQTSVSNEPGQSRLVVFGESIFMKLDLIDRNNIYPNEKDSKIVEKILTRREYRSYRLKLELTETDETPQDTERIPSQQQNDLQYIQSLAKRNNFVFYIEPTTVGSNTAYWGAENRKGKPQPPLSMNMGSATNLESFTAGYNALAGVTPKITINDRDTCQPISISYSAPSPSTLAKNAAPTLRETISRDSAKLNPKQARLRALTMAREGANAADANGILDAAVYGQILRARRLVCVRGAGRTNNETYYIKQVTHKIRRGEYKQHFSLIREGRGAKSSGVCEI